MNTAIPRPLWHLGLACRRANTVDTEVPVSIRRRARWPSAAPNVHLWSPISGCNELYVHVVQHGGWHGRRGARRAGAGLHGVLDADLCCMTVLPGAVGSSREQHRRSRRRHGSQQLLSRSCLLTRPRTHHAFMKACCASPCARPIRVAGRSAHLGQPRVAI